MGTKMISLDEIKRRGKEQAGKNKQKEKEDVLEFEKRQEQREKFELEHPISNVHMAMEMLLSPKGTSPDEILKKPIRIGIDVTLDQVEHLLLVLRTQIDDYLEQQDPKLTPLITNLVNVAKLDIDNIGKINPSSWMTLFMTFGKTFSRFLRQVRGLNVPTLSELFE